MLKLGEARVKRVARKREEDLRVNAKVVAKKREDLQVVKDVVEELLHFKKELPHCVTHDLSSLVGVKPLGEGYKKAKDD